ncbi:MAG: PorT family protein [Candidatus Fibromonas sp.]|nr:PorT family protein [Candidatus Fibromonas sp.]
MKVHSILHAFALTGVLAISHASENWTGDGGKGASITIDAPKSTGLAESQSHLPTVVQAELISNFTNYSDIEVLDWENLGEIYSKLGSGVFGGESTEAAMQDLGQLASTTHFMTGRITKSGTSYHLQMTITKTSNKMTIASYSGTFSYWDLDNLTGIRKASLELLKKMGVSLTAKAQEELAGAATASYASGQAAFAKGMAAQRQGNEVAALSYYFQAAAFDPSMREAASRSSTLNASIASGSMGDNVRNDIQWRKQWVDRLTETEQFFDNFNKMESMPYTLFYSKDINQGKINYQNETVALSIETYLYGSGIWTVSIERALQAVYDGLNATKRKDDWELGRWPQRGVTDLNAFEKRSNNFSVVFELVNNQNKVIGRQTLQSGGSWGLNWSGRPRVEMSNASRKTLNFQNVNANDITDNLTIRVADVNGTDAETAAIDGILQIKAITKSEADLYDSFRFSRGEVQGYRHTNIPKTLVIPDAIWGDPVLSIGEKAFYDKRDITIGASITIGANVDMAKNSFPYYRPFYLFGQQPPDSSFQHFYNGTGKKAGTYVLVSTIGNFQEWRNESEFKQEKEQEEERRLKLNKRLIRLGVRLRGGLFDQDPNAGSELFGKSYANYEEMGKAKGRRKNNIANAAYFTPGLTLGLRITHNIALATELNYNLVFNYNFWYGDGGEEEKEDFAKVLISYQTIEVPVLLRWFFQDEDESVGFYIEAGFQFGFPVNSKATVSSGSEFPGSPFKDEFSDFRVERDQEIVFGFGLRFLDFSLGGRFTVPLTKLDRYGTVEAPLIGSFTLAYDIF